MQETNLGLEAIQLFLTQETYTNYQIDRKNLKVEHLVSQMEDLEKFLALLSKKSSEFKKSDPSHNAQFVTPEETELISRLMNNNDLNHIFHQGKYSLDSLQEGEIIAVTKQIENWIKDDNLKRLVNERIEGPLQRKINQEIEESTQLQNELTKVLEIFKETTKNMEKFIQMIQNNMSRMH